MVAPSIGIAASGEHGGFPGTLSIGNEALTRMLIELGRSADWSTGIVFVPIFAGLVLLFYDSRLKWGWALFYVGLAIIVIEILSRIRFQMGMQVSNLLLMLGMIAAGIGIMLRSFRDQSAASGSAGPRAPRGL